MNKEEILEQLKSGIAEVIFTKKDGTERKMIGTLLEAHVRDKLVGSGRKVPAHLVPLIDLEKDEWRSFDIDSLKSFKLIND